MRTWDFLELTPSSWDKAKLYGRMLTNYDNFVFRGQEVYCWPLKPTLQRVAEKFNYSLSMIWGQEKDILKIFQSRAHHYLKSSPAREDLVEWLSILRHYGGPTRLLDFTSSFYIASFFAMEAATQDASVWAINNHLLNREATKRGYIKPVYEDYDPAAKPMPIQLAESCIKDVKQELNFVLSVAPPRLNERLSAQQGLFLFPCNYRETFEGNLCKMFNLPFDTLATENAKQVEEITIDVNQLFNTLMVKMKLPIAWHKEALQELFQMNISYASLYPDLEGFAKSLYSTGRILQQEASNYIKD